MRPCSHCGHALMNAEKICPSCGSQQNGNRAGTHGFIGSAPHQSDRDVLPCDARDRQSAKYAIVVLALLPAVGGGLWYATGHAAIGIVGMLVVLGIVDVLHAAFSILPRDGHDRQLAMYVIGVFAVLALAVAGALWYTALRILGC